jgi:DNA-binding GntR family transcriptional regulator
MASSVRPPATSLRPVSTVEALVSALREQILDGTLEAGRSVREADFAEAFGVSRHTVRVALQALAHEGLVRHEANRGATVAQLTPGDVADVFHLRTTIEVDAVRTLSLTDGGAPVAGAHEALAALEAVSDAAGWGALRDADIAFHQALVDALGSARTSRTHGALMSEMRLAFLLIRDEFRDRADLVRQHREILSAIESGDAEGAERRLRMHLVESRERIDAVLGPAVS